MKINVGLRMAGTGPILAGLFLHLAVAGVSGRTAHAGVNVWTSHGPEGGYVSLLAASPGEPTRLLAATMSGARTPIALVWRSADGAASWQWSLALGDFGQVRELVFDPSNPSFAYAATSAGILTTRDGGEHWTLAAAVSTTHLAVAPSKPTTVYAAGESGQVLISTDGALSWTQASSGLPGGGRASDLAVHPNSELTVFASSSTEVFRSSDGGATWSPASAGLPDPANARIVALAFDFGHPPRLLAVVQDQSGQQSDLFRSTDLGATWSAAFHQAGYRFLSTVAVSRTDPTRIYLGTSQTVFRSSDDGATWSQLGIPVSTNVSIAALITDPNDAEVVYAGVSGGPAVLRSDDGGTTWRPSSRGLAATSVQALTLGPAPDFTLHALAQSFHNFSEVYRSPDQGSSWESPGDVLTCPFPTEIVADPSDPDVLYVGSRASGAYKSTDGGRSWTRIIQGLDQVVPQVHSLAIAPSNPRTLYAGSRRFFDFGMWWGELFYKTTDGGMTWRTASSGLGVANLGQTIDAVAVDRRDPRVVYAGGLHLWRSTNAGSSWTSLSSSATAPTSVVAIALDPDDSATVFCVGKDAVFTTTDGGSSWRKFAPPSGAATVAVDRMDPAKIYVGGYGGVSMSADGGTSWTLINAGLVVPHVTALVIDRTGDVLHAATDGGGVFDLELSIGTPAISVTPERLAIPPGTTGTLSLTITPPQLTATQLVVRCSNPELVSVPASVTLPPGVSTVVLVLMANTTTGSATVSVQLPDSLGGAVATADVMVASTSLRRARRLLRIRPQ